MTVDFLAPERASLLRKGWSGVSDPLSRKEKEKDNFVSTARRTINGQYNWMALETSAANSADPFYLLYLNGQYQQIITEADKILEETPDDETALEYKGASHLMRQEYGQSLESYKLLSATDPTNANHLTGLAISYEKTGQIAEAEQNFLAAYKQNPATLGNLINFYRHQGRHDEALQYTEELLSRQNSDDRLLGYFLKVDILKEMGRDPRSVYQAFLWDDSVKMGAGLDSLRQVILALPGSDGLEAKIRAFEEVRGDNAGSAPTAENPESQVVSRNPGVNSSRP